MQIRPAAKTKEHFNRRSYSLQRWNTHIEAEVV